VPAPVSPPRLQVGLVSDTHGRLDPRVATALAGSERILHAGDVGRPAVIWELQAIAPVLAVSGNVDHWEMPGEELAPLVQVTLAGRRITVVHNRADLPAHAADSADIIVFGHSHMPLVQEVDGVLWVNPGSASQARRSEIGRSVGILELVAGETPRVRIVPLSDFGVQQ